MKYDAIFFDFDGTLSSLVTHKIPESAFKAIEKVQEKGIKTFLATGRHPMVFMQDDQANLLEFDAYLTSNGQYCYNKDEIIHRKYIPIEDKLALVDALKQRSVPILFLAQNDIFINMIDHRVKEANKVLRSQDAPIKPAEQCLEQDIFALLLYGDTADEEYITSKMPHCKTVRWHHTFTDVIPLDGGKNIGIKAMLDYYNLDIGRTIAFGDAHNDIDMLKQVGLGIAMGNASDDVKAIADYVTDSVDDNGIYNALKHFEII